MRFFFDISKQKPEIKNNVVNFKYGKKNFEKNEFFMIKVSIRGQASYAILFCPQTYYLRGQRSDQPFQKDCAEDPGSDLVEPYLLSSN